MIEGMSPILFVEEIEPCLGFWVEKLGFQVIAQVPDEDRLGFAMLRKEDLQVMYQTHRSVARDLVGVQTQAGGCLYCVVKDFDAVVKAMEGVETPVPPRKTFYGADEIFVREPGGNLIGFSFHRGEE
ncbi:MAG TPA: hypothetical protein DD435_12365 [Cyanobacteria bacterium UBA8530]|nr:hypothetical protein [Cyanobacteria bacterium UBA8530]